ncbi:MAG: glycoside hydrolase family 5 protein [Streptosporangiaceae bacterium]
MSLALPLSTSGRFIVDARGRRVRLAGVNWAGASEDMGVPVGLDQVNRSTLAELIAAMGFNSVRFPFSLWMTEQSHPVPDQYLAANQDLYGKTPMEVYDACVRALTGAGLIVIPNCHLLDYGWCCSTGDENGLWFNDRWPAQKFTQAWQGIAKRYASNPLIAAMDIKNEPREATVGAHVLTPTWGTGGQTDIAAMYTTVGNLIHEIAPGPLIICEGLNYATSLAGVASHPIRLTRPGKVVYSMHDYSWDHAQGQSQAAYAEQMNKTGGYILTEKIAPLWIGELGDNTGSLATFGLAEPSQPDGAPPVGWWINLQAWLTEADVDWCWWALNPTHGTSITPPTGPVKYNWGDPEPYGLLASNWTAAGSPALMKMLLSLTQPHMGPGVGQGAPPPGAT